jgi:hypothetical protein
MAMLEGELVGHRPARIGLAVLDGFLGVTAVLGGLGLLFRVPFVTPPVDLLAGSPFDSYFIPGLALLVLVGGGGMLAATLLARRLAWGVPVSAAAGVMILVFEAVELTVIGFTGLLAFYVALGLAIIALAVWLWLAEGIGTMAVRHAHA